MLRACGVSDIGRVRKTNEDTFVSDPDMRLFAVADGMGGHSAGEVASRLAIEAITAFIRRSATDADFTWPYGLDETLSFDGNRLRTAIRGSGARLPDSRRRDRNRCVRDESPTRARVRGRPR